MLVNYPGGALNTFDFLTKYPVKIITFEQTISGKEKKSIGHPNGKFKIGLVKYFMIIKKLRNY